MTNHLKNILLTLQHLFLSGVKSMKQQPFATVKQPHKKEKPVGKGSSIIKKEIKMTYEITMEDLRQKNFTPDEFLRSNTSIKLGIKNEYNQQQLRNGVKLAAKIQEIRDRVNEGLINYSISMPITSGFRCAALNKAVGGSATSWHMKFLACDFNIDALEPHTAVLAIKHSKVSVDKVFVERGCVHLQTCLDDKDNRNFFGTAVKINGEWKVSNQIKKV